MRSASRRTGATDLVALLLLAIVAAGCGAFGAGASPDPGCPTGDVRAPGTLPKLEALLPRVMISVAPTALDSGWNCSKTALGSYVSHGVTKLSFAGATWDQGAGNATVTAILALESGPLNVAWVEEFYTAGAVAARRIRDVKTDRPTYEGAGQVFRIETINDLSLQTVVIWPSAPYVHVVIVATQVSPEAVRTDHDERLRIAVEVSATVPVP